MGLPKALDHKELACQSKDLGSRTTRFSEHSKQVKCPDKAEVKNVLENAAKAKQIKGCASVNPVSSTKNRVFNRTSDKRIKEEIQDGNGFRRNLEGNAPKERCEQVQGRTFSEGKLKQDKATEEISIISPPESNLYRSHFKWQTVGNKIDGGKSLAGRKGKELEKCSKDKSNEDESGMLRVFKCKLTNSTCGYEGQKYEFMGTAEKSESVLLKKKEETRISERKFTKDKSLLLSVEAADRGIGPLIVSKEKQKNIGAGKKSNDLGFVPFEDSQAVLNGNKVLETLNLFEEMFRKLSQEQQAKLEAKKGAHRIRIEAAMLLKKQQKWVNTSKQLGPVPGVEIGDNFHFRIELVIIGLHCQFSGGIDYMKKDGNIFATSIVASDRYANVVKSSDVLIYSGQGGNPMVTDKQPEDQKLERGNLALKNSMDANTPVRVIRGGRGLKASNLIGRSSKRILGYTYGGLYIVNKYWQERGQFGKLVFKFQLTRIPVQPKLTRGVVSRSKESEVRKGLCLNDISQGKEEKPIRVVNTIDDEKPPSFCYITNMIYPEWYSRSIPSGCDCTNGCFDSEKCSCAVKNGGEIPFNYKGTITKMKPLIYECGPFCKCPSSCNNRISQCGIRFQLEVFKTESSGWGVRSRSYIPSGSFICEYVGELLRVKEAEQRIGNDEYLFDMGNNYKDYTLRDGLVLSPDSRSSSLELMDNNGFTIDAAQHGNVGRFINHTCSPNLYAQNVLYDHDDKRMPHIMLFATKNIPPLRELTY